MAISSGAFVPRSGGQHAKPIAVVGNHDVRLVAIAFVGNSHSCILDAKSTISILDGKLVKVVGWYDNEWGYSNRAVDMLNKLGGSV